MDAVLFSECNGIAGFGRDAGAYIIASRLRKHGLSVQSFDFFSFFDKDLRKLVVDKLITPSTKLIGFSSTHISRATPDLLTTDFFGNESRADRLDLWNTYFPFSDEETNSFLKLIKEKAPHALIVVGGQKVMRKVVLQKKYPLVDYWLGGYAEEAVLELLNTIQSKSPLPKRKRLSAEADFSEYQQEKFAYDFIEWDRSDFITSNESLPLEISRGCNFSCAFCDYTKKKKALDWTKDFSSLRNHLLENYEKFGTTSYMITDSLVNESLDKMKLVHKTFKSLPFEIEWSGFFRHDLIGKYPEMVDLAVDSGAKSLQLGIESINPRNHKHKIGKNFELEKIEQALKNFRERAGDEIILGSGFIIGLPEDREEDVKELFDWISNPNQILNAWEVCPLFIGTYHPDREKTIHFSRIQKSPESYGYSLNEEKTDRGHIENWTNMHGLTKKKCIEMLETFQKSPTWHKRLLANWLLYSRLRNLGFTHQECLRSETSNEDFVGEVSKRYLNLARSYIQKVNDHLKLISGTDI